MTPFLIMSLLTQEQNKYKETWSHQDYRHTSPGEESAQNAINKFDYVPGDSINDYGAGTGRASVVFKANGLQPLCIDIADNAQDSGLDSMVACLWDMPKVPFSDYAYCCDVMEHIPPEKVNDVLDQIRQKTRKQVYFQIAHFKDEWHGQKLHLTVMPPEWWKQQLSKYFIIKEEETPKPQRTGFWCTPLRDIEIKSHINTDIETLLENVKINSARGLKEVKQGKEKAYPVAIVGTGPSLEDTYQELKHFDRVIAVNGAHDFLIEKGVKPWAYVLCDASPKCINFLQHPKKYIKYFIGSKAHPSIFEKLKGFDVTIFHELMDIGEPENVTRIGGGCSVSLRSLNLFAFQGYSAFYLFGIDSCYRGDQHHIGTQTDITENIFPVVVNGREFKCSTQMIQQAEDFKLFIKSFGEQFKLFVVGDGLLSEICKPRGNLNDSA